MAYVRMNVSYEEDSIARGVNMCHKYYIHFDDSDRQVSYIFY